MVQFKEIKDFPNYLVSDTGQVYSGKTNRIMKGGINPVGKGYRTVTLRRNNKNITKVIHRLVAETFIPNLEDKPEVNHKDGNTRNNCVENLEWCTRCENAVHSWSNGLQTKIVGEKNHMWGRFNGKHHRSKKVYQLDMQGTLIKVWESLMDVKRNTDYQIGHISQVCNGKRRHHKNFKWTYNEVKK